MGYLVDMSLPSEEVLLGQINNDNDTEFTFDLVQFSKRGVDPADIKTRDSMITLESKVGSGWHGRQRFYYDRINLNDYLGNRFLFVPWGSVDTTEQLLDTVYEEFGIKLHEDDVLDDYINNGEMEREIRMSPRSVAYVGSIKVVFANHPDSLNGRVQNHILDGFVANQY